MMAARHQIKACGTIPPDVHDWQKIIPPEETLLEISADDLCLFVYRDRLFPDLLNLVRVEASEGRRSTLTLFDQPANDQWISTVIDAAGINAEGAKYRFHPAEDVAEEDWKFLDGAVAYERLDQLVATNKRLGITSTNRR